MSSPKPNPDEMMLGVQTKGSSRSRFNIAAKWHELLGNRDKAAVAREKAGDIHGAAQIYKDEGDYKKALGIYKRNRYEKEAQSVYVEALECYGKKNDFISLALVHTEMGEEEKAAECHCKAGLYGSAGGAYIGLWKLERASADSEKAKCYKNKIIECAEALLEKGGKQCEHAANLFRQVGESAREAEAYFAAGDFRKAEIIFTDLHMKERAAECHFRLREFLVAATIFDSLKMVERVRKCAEACNIEDSNEGLQAAKAYSNSKEVEGPQAAKIYSLLKEKEKEGEVYEKLRMFTEAANVFVQEARQRKSAGESEKAVELFIKAGKNFESADVFMRALNSYIEAGRNDLAFAYAKKETKSESERIFRLSMVKRKAEQKQQEAFQAGRMRR